ncbi:unnamed protein product [Boreogadus saida]
MDDRPERLRPSFHGVVQREGADYTVMDNSSPADALPRAAIMTARHVAVRHHAVGSRLQGFKASRLHFCPATLRRSDDLSDLHGARVPSPAAPPEACGKGIAPWNLYQRPSRAPRRGDDCYQRELLLPAASHSCGRTCTRMVAVSPGARHGPGRQRAS